MDWLYDRLFVAPVVAFARVNRNDVIDSGYAAIARFVRLCNHVLSLSENGRLAGTRLGLLAAPLP